MESTNRNRLIGNPAVLRRPNRTRMMNQSRQRGSASRVQMARTTGLDPKTVTNLYNGLLQSGLIVPRETQARGRGRPAGRLRIKLDAALAVGVNLGAQQVCAIGRMINMASRQWHKRIQGTGVCVPGFRSREAGVVVRSVNIRRSRGLSIVEALSGYGRPVILEESSRSMAPAEEWFGGRDMDEGFVCMDLGCSIGMDNLAGARGAAMLPLQRQLEFENLRLQARQDLCKRAFEERIMP